MGVYLTAPPGMVCKAAVVTGTQGGGGDRQGPWDERVVPLATLNKSFHLLETQAPSSFVNGNNTSLIGPCSGFYKILYRSFCCGAVGSVASLEHTGTQVRSLAQDSEL